MNVVKKAFDVAINARKRAHAPYSKFLVGAAVKVKGHDSLFAGCNVENACYPAGICAERSAIASLISQLGKVELEFLLLVTDSPKYDVPCGICLQVLSEFCPSEFPLYLANLKGVQRQATLKDFLPHRFDGLEN